MTAPSNSTQQRPRFNHDQISKQTLIAEKQDFTCPDETKESLPYGGCSYPQDLPSFNGVFEDASRASKRLKQEAASNGWMELYPVQSKVLVADITAEDIDIMPDLKENQLREILNNPKHPRLRMIFLTATPGECDKKWHLNATCKSIKDIICKYGLPAQTIPYFRNPVRENFGSQIAYHQRPLGSTTSGTSHSEVPRLDFWYRLGTAVMLEPGTDKLDWIFVNSVTHIDDDTGDSVIIFKTMYTSKLAAKAAELSKRCMNVIQHAHGTEKDPFAFHLWLIEWMQAVWRESIDDMWWDAGIQNMTKAGPEELRMLDLGVLHRQRELLESYNNWLRVQKDVIAGLSRQHKEFLSSFSNKPPISISHRVDVALQTIAGHCDYLISSAAGSNSRAHNFINLHFSLTAQQDSRMTSEISKQTHYDSFVMKTIAVMTMIFLPGTFVSAIFSMSFFQVNPNNGSLHVSSMLWTYAAVTIPLTILTLVAWRYWMKWSGSRLRKPGRNVVEKSKV